MTKDERSRVLARALVQSIEYYQSMYGTNWVRLYPVSPAVLEFTASVLPDAEAQNALRLAEWLRAEEVN